MKIRPAMRVLHGNPAREFYVVEVKDGAALLMRTTKNIYNTDGHCQKWEDGRDKPYYPYWASFDELFFKYESGADTTHKHQGDNNNDETITE